MIKKAVILAGGFGTRLRPLTFTKPKPMVPLVNKPVIEHVVDYLVSHGLNDIVVTTTFLRETIMDHFRYREDVHLTYPTEPYPLGTAGSVKNAGLDEENDEPFVVIQGDNITDMDLRRLILREGYNDFAAWIRDVFRDDKLASEVVGMQWWEPRSKLISTIQERISEL